MNRYVMALVLLVVTESANTFAQSESEPPAVPAIELPDFEAGDAPVISREDLESSPSSQVTHTPGEGITVSMLNETTHLKLFAQFSTLAVYSSTRPFASGEPLLLFPGLVDDSTRRFDLHARQSAIGAAFTGPEVLEMTPGAHFLAFILNDTLVSDDYGFLPVNAYGELKNERWRFAGGLQNDLFNPLRPTMNTIVNLSLSGNTGSYRGQLRLEHFHNPSSDIQLTTQMALSEAVSTIIVDNSRLLEDNGWPNLEGRLALGLGTALELAGGRKMRPIEFGVSGLIGELRNTVLFETPSTPPPEVRSVIQVWGLGTDVQAALSERFGLAGELFIGQGLGDYSGLIGQSFGRSLRAISGSGGFGEAYYYLTDQLHLHTGYGIDDADDEDLSLTQITRNQTYYANLIWDISKTIQISGEVNFRKTNYVLLPDADGTLFLTQFLWRF